MASENDEKKKAKPAAAAKSADKPAKAEKVAKAAKAPKKEAAPYDGPPCRVEGCKQPVRAKGYCRGARP